MSRYIYLVIPRRLRQFLILINVMLTIHQQQSYAAVPQVLIYTFNLVCFILSAGCNTGDSRLTHSDNTASGIVEVCFNNVWYPLCNEENRFINVVNVICRSLGFNYSAHSSKYNIFINSALIFCS